MKFLKGEIKIILIYLLIGFGWIYFSDRISFWLTDSMESFSEIQSLKGIFYVILTAIILYFLIRNYLQDIQAQKEEVNALNEQLTAYNEELLAMNEELDQSFNEINVMNSKFVTMIKFISEIDKQASFNEDEFLGDLLKNAVRIIPEADYGTIFSVKNNNIQFIDAIGHDIEQLKKVKIAQENILYYDKTYVFTSEDYAINLSALPEKAHSILLNSFRNIKKSLYINITINEIIVGRISLDIAANSSKDFRENSPKILESFAILASAFYAFKHYDSLQNRFTKELVGSIIKILEIHDNYTKGHSENVAELAAQIARKMDFPGKIVVDTYWTGMVHDIGKLLVPVNILNKNSKLNQEEFELIKNHPVWGSEALAGSNVLKHISNYVLHHHERWDGAGYPSGLKKDQIPIVSQIITVADAWDAMRSDRSYRDSLTESEAIREIVKGREKQFSPEVVDNFLKLVEQGILTGSDIQPDNIYFNNINEQYFKYLFEETTAGIVILDKDFKIIRCNEYFIKLFELDNYQVIGKNIKKLIVPVEKFPETDQFMEEIRNNKRINSHSFRQKNNGEMVEVAIQGFSISIRAGEPGYYIIYQDITEIKSLEAKYLNSKNKYEALFRNDDVVMMIIDPANGNIISANPAAEKFYGWSEEELQQKTIFEINTLSKSEVKNEMKQAHNSNKKRFFFKHKLATGEIREVEVYSHPIRFENNEYLYSIVHILD